MECLSGQTADSEWWESEFQEPALPLLNRIREVGQLVTGDAPIIEHTQPKHAGSTYVENRSQQQAGLSQLSWPGPPPMAAIMDARSTGMPGGHDNRGLKRPPADRVHSVREGRFLSTRAGVPLCANYQSGTCGAGVHGRCPVDRSMGHQCNRCLSDQHGGDTGSCNKHASDTSYTSDKGNGKGKNKSKG